MNANQGVTVIITTATRWCLAILAASVALIAAYYCSTLLLVTFTSPHPSVVALVVGFGAQALVCSITCFLAGRSVLRRFGAASNSPQQPTAFGRG
jgi:hypothetical protein